MNRKRSTQVDLRKPLARPPKGYHRVIFGEDLAYCELCGEPVCRHRVHWSDCPTCIGPGEDGIEYLEIAGRLYGRRKASLLTRS